MARFLQNHALSPPPGGAGGQPPPPPGLAGGPPAPTAGLAGGAAAAWGLWGAPVPVLSLQQRGYYWSVFFRIRLVAAAPVAAGAPGLMQAPQQQVMPLTFLNGAVLQSLTESVRVCIHCVAGFVVCWSGAPSAVTDNLCGVNHAGRRTPSRLSIHNSEGYWCQRVNHCQWHGSLCCWDMRPRIIMVPSPASRRASSEA